MSEESYLALRKNIADSFLGIHKKSQLTGEESYLALIKDIMQTGIDKPDRTGVGTRSVFGRQLRFDLAKGFPLLTTKQMELKSVLSELLWFIEGSNDERRLAEIRYGKPREQLAGKRTIWTDNAQSPYWSSKATFDGDLGRPYGVQLRQWTNQYGEVIDQLKALVDGLKNDPYSRRHCITFWNPGELQYMVLPACHQIANFVVIAGNLNCMFTMRSCDVGCGLPYNIASYALLTHMLAQVCGYQAGDLIFSGADVHIYQNHFDGVTEQITRVPYQFPTLTINPNVSDILDFKLNDFCLSEYNSYPAIKLPMAV